MQTAFENLELRALGADDALHLFRLVQDNRDHLTAHGDYKDLTSLPLEAYVRELESAHNANLKFGIFEGSALVGRVDLIPVDPPRYGLGYWLAKGATGKGYATAVLLCVIDFARDILRASDIYAGVTHGNARSERLLERVSFTAVETFEHYTRFHLSLATTPPEL